MTKWITVYCLSCFTEKSNVVQRCALSVNGFVHRFALTASLSNVARVCRREVRKVGNEIFVFLRDKLKLAINREKSGIRRPFHFIILGFGFVPSFVKGEKGRYQLVVSKNSWSKLKEKLKTITRKTTPMSFDERVQKLNEVQQGWVNNFRMANILAKLKLDIYKRISPQLNEPLYTRPVRTVV